MINAVIFDLDGVLAKTDSYHYLSWKRICDNHHFYFDKDINNELRGISREDSLRVILRHNKIELNENEFNDICNEENTFYNVLLQGLNENDLFPGTIPVLKELRKRGIKLAIGTGTKHADEIIDKLNIRKYFDVIIDGNMVSNPKPDPECFLLCSKKLDVKPESTFVIEDADSGIMAAISGNFIPIAVGNAKKSNKAHYNIQDMKDILVLLNQ